ncbi:MAG TPA: hypothetical protein VGO47_10545 [Chlamydiales bacterium]|nr:hypothetical protein [Chlamydiales bacterium]
MDNSIMETFFSIDLTFHTSDEEAYVRLARHLLALKNGVEDLGRRYTLGHSSTDELISYPYPRSFSSTFDGKRTCIPFEYEMRLHGRRIYRARCTAMGSICVKFSRRYGVEVHRWCAARGIAPQFMAIEELQGGWYMVVMENLHGDWCNLDSLIYPHVGGLRATLQEYIKALHAEKMVHGDIRDANIMVYEDKFMLLDFDWAGIVGEVYYPPLLNKNPRLGRPVDVEPGALILPEHDDFMIRLGQMPDMG